MSTFKFIGKQEGLYFGTLRHYHTDYLEFNYLFIAMQFKFSLQPIISILYIFLGIILPPCFCCTGEYKYLFKFLRFLFLVSLPQNNYTNYIRYQLIKVNNLRADNPLYLTQNVFYLTNREALTVPCSVVKHARTKRFEHERSVWRNTRRSTISQLESLL